MLCYALVHRRRWDLCPHLTSPFASRQISSLTPVHTLLHHADPSYFLFLSSFNLQSSPSIPLVFSTIMPQLYARDRTFGTDTPRKQNELALFGSSNVNISIFHRLSGSWLGPKNDWDRRQLSSSIPIDERACSIPHPVTYYLLLNACLSASRTHACYEALLNFTHSLVSIPGPQGPRHFAQPFFD